MAEVPILDYQQGLDSFGGDEETLQSMIKTYDEEYLNRDVLHLHKGIMKRDFNEIQVGGYIIKGPASYIGAQRLYNISAELQRKGAAQEPMSEILKDYIEFLNVERELKREIAKILKRPVSLDIADFDIFEKQVKIAFPEYFTDPNVSPVCHGCNIF